MSLEGNKASPLVWLNETPTIRVARMTSHQMFVESLHSLFEDTDDRLMSL